MKGIKVVHWLLFFVLFFWLVVSLPGDQKAIASQESDNSILLQTPSQKEPPREDKIELKALYPVLKEKAGRLFEFPVELHYQGSKARVFDLSVVATREGYIDILASFTATDKGIESILLNPDEEFPARVRVRYNPTMKEPGRYVITLQASSGDISDSIELTAVVTARYELSINTDNRRLNAEVTAGKDNHIGVLVWNRSSVALEDVRFGANVPQGWGVNFSPDMVGSLGIEFIQKSDMVITPPSNTIAGVYEITVMAITDETFAEMKLRITVTTPTIWGWVGILIVVAVIAGLAVIFGMLGRR